LSTGVLLMTFGTSVTSDGVEDYLRSVYRREPPADTVTEFKRRFDLVGRSPLIDITLAQGAALQALLDREHGRGRFLVRFGSRSAFQIEGTYDGFQSHRDGQLDMGLANRVQRVQLGLFTSVRYVDLEAYDRGVSVSQFGATLDYIFRGGRVGLFGAAGLQDTEPLGRPPSNANSADDRALHLIDQFGASAQVGVSDRAQVQGHLSFLNPTCQGRTTAGSIRLIYPVSEDWALTAEGAWNPTLVERSTQARFIVGAQRVQVLHDR